MAHPAVPVHHPCPRCGGATDRVARHFMDRLVSLFMPSGRYQCRSYACGWEGRQPRSGASN